MANGRGGSPRPCRGAQTCVEEDGGKNHSREMFALGALHSGAHGLPADRAIARRWFTAAAERGHGQAQLMLGQISRPRAPRASATERKGRTWLERAVAQGVSEAETDLADLKTVLSASMVAFASN